MGYLDDEYNLSATFKLLVTVFFITLLVFLEDSLLIKSLQFSFISKSFFLNYYASLFFTVFCFIVYINAFNFFDGINLQSAIYSLFIFFIFLFKSYNTNLILSIIIGIIFFIYLNSKNKCFLGNNGSMLLGFLISYFFIDSYNKNLFFADEIFIIMFIPGIELSRLFFLRLSRGQSPMSPDKEHLHHYLLNKYDLTRSNFFIANLIFIPCSLNFFLNFKYSAYIIIINFFIYTWFIYFLNKKNAD
jgi:UDP-N-acetylmuramyl pentapeptide phosphotransferase/UDP-N-acetylglucosamine-1-phosphate transferase